MSTPPDNLTTRFITQLERGIVPWHKPWPLRAAREGEGHVQSVLRQIAGDPACLVIFMPKLPDIRKGMPYALYV